MLTPTRYSGIGFDVIPLSAVAVKYAGIFTLLPVTWLQLDGMIWISKTTDFATAADHMQKRWMILLILP